MSEQAPLKEQFYRVAEVIRSESECKCPACVLWTIVYDDQGVTEIGTSWQGDEGKEAAEDVCDLMNMAFDAGQPESTSESADCEAEATRDMLTDARLELDALRAALGINYEPHQSLHERMLDAANHKRVERTVHEPLDRPAEMPRGTPLGVALRKLSMVMGNPALHVGKWESMESALVDEARHRLEERASQPPPVGPPWEFDRYQQGRIMAEGIVIERETTFEAAALRAARMADRLDVLVLRRPTLPPSDEDGWISTGDELPADGTDVLYAFNGHTFIGKYLGCDNEDGLPCFGGSSGWLTGDVMFWRLAPKAPESTRLTKAGEQS